MNLLTVGNMKLGPSIASFSIPPVVTCPGRSPTCEECCYATRGRFVLPAVRRLLEWNYKASKRPTFAEDVVEEIQRRRIKLLRVHVSGDFYSSEYTTQWLEVVRAVRKCRFYGYTRSWREPSILPVLAEMALEKNMRLWFSADSDTGLPPPVPGVRTAWLMTEEGEAVPKVDLVFRTHPLRKSRSKRVGLSLVCPTETGSRAATDCGRCGHCWRG
jgi:hypothetical protein